MGHVRATRRLQGIQDAEADLKKTCQDRRKLSNGRPALPAPHGPALEEKTDDLDLCREAPTTTPRGDFPGPHLSNDSDDQTALVDGLVVALPGNAAPNVQETWNPSKAFSFTLTVYKTFCAQQQTYGARTQEESEACLSPYEGAHVGNPRPAARRPLTVWKRRRQQIVQVHTRWSSRALFGPVRTLCLPAKLQPTMSSSNGGVTPDPSEH
eukprot:CAMPEP_0194525466 /NCGR_PEP_ID=MMETSP0253-20130528/60941_1 /TAXON_ID=2966 /ORGANISM="Noctiluca scintillans" /LENGTH=209 /DNA_ID=CAMNT_0039370199 /DNA_START=41 /DNA_END=673 /DNA_ORIENTATION=-